VNDVILNKVQPLALSKVEGVVKNLKRFQFDLYSYQ